MKIWVLIFFEYGNADQITEGGGSRKSNKNNFNCKRVDDDFDILPPFQ